MILSLLFVFYLFYLIFGTICTRYDLFIKVHIQKEISDTLYVIVKHMNFQYRQTNVFLKKKILNLVNDLF